MEGAGTHISPRIREAYEAFDVPASLMPETRTSHAMLLKILESIEPKIPGVPRQLVPTSFDPADPELRAFPRPLGWHWTSAERMLRAFGSHGIMMRLPLFWQLEPALFAAGQAAGAPIFVNDQDNMPVGAAAIKTASMDTVITDTQDAFRFSSYLSETGAQFPTAWIIVHPALLDVWEVPAPLREAGARVAQEVHLFPGVPFLEQCEFLAANKDPAFHTSEVYTVETEGDGTYLTSAGDDPLPLFRYELRRTLTESGECACGKRVFNSVR